MSARVLCNVFSFTWLFDDTPDVSYLYEAVKRHRGAYASVGIAVIVSADNTY